MTITIDSRRHLSLRNNELMLSSVSAALLKSFLYSCGIGYKSKRGGLFSSDLGLKRSVNGCLCVRICHLGGSWKQSSVEALQIVDNNIDNA